MEDQKKIDVVYVLGKGSTWGNNEIRFSLRSLEKNLQNFGEVWIIGECPEWLTGVRHIPFKDELENNADGNIARKVLRVCHEEDLTDDFLFINDDHLVMKPIEAINILPYHKGDMTGFDNSYFELNFWRGRLWRTKNILVEKGLTAFHFDCHVPMVMNKHLFPEVMSKFDFEKNIGFTMKSLYGNVIYKEQAPLLNGEKVTVFTGMIYRDVVKLCRNRQFVAFNDGGLKPDFKWWLCDTFPEASKYENDQDLPFMKVVELLKSNEKDYEKGYSLFLKYGRSHKAMKYLSKGESNARMMKLVHLLRELLNYL